MTAAPQSTPALPPLPELPDAMHTPSEVLALMRADRRQIVELCAQQIPTNWLDDLLTGKDGLGQPPYYCPNIERLLSKLAERLRSLLDGEAK